MKIISSKGNQLVLEHNRYQDESPVEIEVKVDAISKKFIKENINNITYDVTTGYLRLINKPSTLVSRAIYEENWMIPQNKNVCFEDGDRLNLDTKNLIAYE